MKVKRLYLILFVMFSFLMVNNVYAAECKYNEGGIACCKKYGKVNVSAGKEVEPVCPSNSWANLSDYSECYVLAMDVTNQKFDSSSKSGKTKSGCEQLNDSVFNRGESKVKNCNWVSYKNACLCNVYSKKSDKKMCTNWQCPKGSQLVVGSTTARGQKPTCIATTTTKVDGCIEYEKQEAERVCPASIEWEVSAEIGCFSKLSSYSDSLNWDDCVYSDDTMKEEAYGDSVYCPVYCLESFNIDAFNYTPLVKAGTNFTFPSKDNYLEGSRWCTTKYINYDKFLSDLEYANKQIEKFYSYWKRDEAIDKLISEYQPSDKPDCADICDYNVGEECCKSWEDDAATCDATCSDIDEDGNSFSWDCSYSCPGCAIAGFMSSF